MIHYILPKPFGKAATKLACGAAYDFGVVGDRNIQAVDCPKCLEHLKTPWQKQIEREIYDTQQAVAEMVGRLEKLEKKAGGS